MKTKYEDVLTQFWEQLPSGTDEAANLEKDYPHLEVQTSTQPSHEKWSQRSHNTVNVKISAGNKFRGRVTYTYR